MPKKMLIDATHAEETRVVVVEGNKVDEFDFESLNKRQLSGNIYLAKVTRVEPSLQAAFIDYGGNRHGFLAFAEIHPDYYQIPVADREALLAEEESYTKSLEEAEKEKSKKSRIRKRKTKSVAIETSGDATIASDVIENLETESSLVEVLDTSNAGNKIIAESESNEEALSGESHGNSVQNNTEEPTLDISNDITNEIETLEENNIDEDIQPRKPRPRRYKIQEVIKVRQILLIQVVKEERGNKGAALTTYLSLAGRYCVLMPNTARGGGISRKITNIQDRKNIKEITNELEIAPGAGLIVRTAGAKRNRDDILRDYEYLMRQWSQIRDLTLESIAPTQIYAEGDIIKRSIRDLYNSEIDEIIVDGERGFAAAKAYMTMLMPTHIDRVKEYKDKMPLFAKHQVENYLGSMFNPTVQLKSGGYIVIGVTEALVAIDVNSGKATKETSIEKTALKTNLEAAEEVARQLRLRDLAGLIVIDFIDMEERRNNIAVEKRIKDKLKTDRARIQVGRISGFGLMEMSRQRLRPGMIEATTKECPHCLGTGLVRSDDSQALSILREIEDEAVKKRSKEICATVPVGIANYLMNHKRDNIILIESQYGISIIIEASSTMIGTEYNLDKRKNSSRIVADVFEMPTAREMEAVANIEVSAPQLSEETAQVSEETTTPSIEDEDKPKKRRRRRRRRTRKDDPQQADGAENITELETHPIATVIDPSESLKEDAVEIKIPKKRSVRSQAPKEKQPSEVTIISNNNIETVQSPINNEGELIKAPRKKRRTKAQIAEDLARKSIDQAPIIKSDINEEAKIKPKRTRASAKGVTPKTIPLDKNQTDLKEAKILTPKKRVPKKAKKLEEEIVTENASVGTIEKNDTQAVPPKPKKRGWWSKS
ncbi:MAG: ribonuclease E/G [Amylibacter sp.]|jgi:ribonuclease E|tara:strand:+ start:8818 stop:11472 length:2655 start_codon:yes stop_codon:yes gene_type:complete